MDRWEKILNKPWVPVCLYAAIVFLLYGASLHYGLTFLDDNVWLHDYRWYLKDLSRIGKVFTESDVLFGGLFYRPLIYVSFILDTQWAGGGLFSYHLTNMLLHIADTTLVFYLLRQFGITGAGAFLGGLLFCVHPSLVSAVAWIPGRTDTLLALFVLSSLYFFIRWVREGGGVSFAAHLLFWALALLTKETAVVLPVLWGMYIFLFSRPEKKRPQAGLAVLFWGLVLAGYFFLRAGAVNPHYHTSFGSMLASAWANSPALLLYLGKAVFPVNVSVLPVLQDGNFLFGVCAAAVLVALVFFAPRRNNAVIFFGSAWFFLLLAPALIYAFLLHGYRLYVPLFGFILLLLESLRPYRWHGRFLLALCVLFAALSFWHASHYKDRIAFWQNAVATSPHAPLAHRNLGAMYFLDKKYALAEREFLAALKLNPREKMVHNNLGLIALLKGEDKKAEEEYLAEIKINPYYDNVYYNLGLLYASQKRYAAMEAAWQKAVALNPRNLAASEKLIRYYISQKEYTKARRYSEAIRKRGAPLPAY